MRARSSSVYASNEENFFEEIEQCLSTSQREKWSFKEFPILDYSDSEYSDLIGADKSYEIEMIPLSLKEQEKIEEEHLMSLIRNLNLNKEKYINSESSTEEESDYLGVFNSNEIEINEYFISQNVILYEDYAKLMVLGETKVGKSLFIKKTISSHIDNREYIPTISLDISKTIIKIKDKKTKIELWDTSASMLNSKLIYTYYKLAHGFVIITDYSHIEEDITLSFISDKIEKIRKVSNYSCIMVLVNQDRQIEKKNEYNHIIKNFAVKHYISFSFCKLSSFSSDNEDFQNFVAKILVGKNPKRKSYSVCVLKESLSVYGC